MSRQLMTGRDAVVRDIFYLVSLIFLPTVVSTLYVIQTSKTTKLLNVLDDLIYFVMALTVIYRILKHQRLISYNIVIIYIAYSLFLIFKNNLPIKHILQIFITFKCFIAYYYFNSLNDQHKDLLLLYTHKIMIVIFMLSSVLSVFELLSPVTFHNITHARLEYRGLFNVALSSFASSRVFYAEFLLLFFAIYHTFNHDNKYYDVLTDFTHKYLPFMLGYFYLIGTASRKEIAIGIIIFPLMFLLKNKGFTKIIEKMLFVVVIAAAIYGMVTIFQQINEVALSDKYVRLFLMFTAFRIFADYFPFGSGPGTYGSTMSINYTNIYEKYDVGPNILGYDDSTRGPIYDMFATSSIAEYGLGISIFIYLIYRIYHVKLRSTPLMLARTSEFISVKKYFTLLVFLLSFFTPVFTNWVGTIIFSILGLINEREDKLS